MNYVVRLTYYDNQVTNVLLPKEEIPRFLEAYKEGKEYWGPGEEYAFMTNPEKVRFVNVGKELPKEEIKAEVKEEPKE